MENLNIIEIVISAVFGLALAIVYERIVSFRRRNLEKEKYDYLVGIYSSFNDNGDGKASATVKYVKSNILTIDVIHTENTQNNWSGEINMLTTEMGNLSARYKSHENPEILSNSIDFKTIVTNKNESSFVLFSNTEGFGNEHFKKITKATR